MSADAPLAPAQPPWRSAVWTSENLLLAVALAAMIFFPLAEIVARKISASGISGVASIEQHLTLIVGMLGGAVAARENRLLTLSSLGNLLKGNWRTATAVFTSAISVAVTVFLALGAWAFVQLEREGAKQLSYGIPLWVVQLSLPIGFLLIALRLWWHAPGQWRVRLFTAVAAGALIWFCLKVPASPAPWVPWLLAGVLLATIMGAPVYVLLGGAALVLFWGQDVAISVMAQEHYRQVVNPSLPTIPLFTLAGYFLAEGGASQRFIRVFDSLLGGLRGGPAIVTTLVCAFFTSFTGASGVTILALGGLLMPILLAAQYSERNALGLITGAGSLGLLFPPCLPVILYAIIAGVSMEQMFLGGMLPGLLLLIMTAIWAISKSPALGERRRWDWREARRAIGIAKWELMVPVIALIALFSGWATPVEASAVTAAYALFIETVIYRDLKWWRDVPRVMKECGLLIGGVLLILGVALGFTNYLIDAQIPNRAVEWVTSVIHSKWLFLLAVNAVLLVVGCLMDIYSAIVVVVPILVPLGVAYGIDPVHLGIVFLANMQLGYLTPPVGMNLFLASYRFNKPMSEVVRSVIPMLIVLLIGVLLITYVPPLTTVLPRMFKP
jgi:C4-dicarboxylate transporter DctM subunit